VPALLLDGGRIQGSLAIARELHRLEPEAGRYVSKASDAQVRQDLARLPALLDHADALIDSGTIGGGAPNAADLQILTSARLLPAHDDLRPAIAGRPCGKAALRLIPDYPRSGPDALPPIPAALPPQWLTAPRYSVNPSPAAAAPIRSKQLA
jgi:glutathione S-transferase